jgi:hypothetical protein
MKVTMETRDKRTVGNKKMKETNRPSKNHKIRNEI